MNLQSMTLLHTLFTRGNKFKNRRYTADRAQSLLFEEVASRDWFEQTLVTESRIKAFFGMSVANQLKLIRNATPQSDASTPPAAETVGSQDNDTTEVVTNDLEAAVEAVKLEEEEDRQNEFESNMHVGEEILHLSTDLST